MNEMTVPSRHRIRNMTFNYRKCTTQTDRQTDILLTEIKVITDLFVIVIREIYVHVYTRVLVC